MTTQSLPATGVIAEIIDNYEQMRFLMTFHTEEKELCLYKGEENEGVYESFCASILEIQSIECTEIIVDYANDGVVACYRSQGHLWIVLATTKKGFPRINLEVRKILKDGKNTLHERVGNKKDKNENLAKQVNGSIPQKKNSPEVSVLGQFSSKYFTFDHPKDNEGGGFYWIKAQGGMVQIVVVDRLNDRFKKHEYHAILNSIMEENIGSDINQSASAVQQVLESYNGEMLMGAKLGICYYNKGKSVVQVVSSGVPVLYVSEDNYASVIRPKTVTTHHSNRPKINRQTLDISKGDKLILYTTGLSSQVGKDNNVKLGHKGVRKLFQSMNGNFSSSYFEQELNGWMGSTPPFSDITVLALQI